MNRTQVHKFTDGMRCRDGDRTIVFPSSDEPISTRMAHEEAKAFAEYLYQNVSAAFFDHLRVSLKTVDVGGG